MGARDIVWDVGRRKTSECGGAGGDRKIEAYERMIAVSWNGLIIAVWDTGLASPLEGVVRMSAAGGSALWVMVVLPFGTLLCTMDECETSARGFVCGPCALVGSGDMQEDQHRSHSQRWMPNLAL